jgi:hypothetical protein
MNPEERTILFLLELELEVSPAIPTKISCIFITCYVKSLCSQMLSMNLIYRGMEEESIVENFIKAVEGTKSTVELVFDNITIKLPGMNAVFAINGKLNVTARPVHERQ